MDMLKLFAWTAVIVVLLLLPSSRKLERKRDARSAPQHWARLRRASPSNPEGSELAARVRRGERTGRSQGGC
jgi:hypothetical protein